jgi:hypothetical protein
MKILTGLVKFTLRSTRNSGGVVERLKKKLLGVKSANISQEKGKKTEKKKKRLKKNLFVLYFSSRAVKKQDIILLTAQKTLTAGQVLNILKKFKDLKGFQSRNLGSC